jgi:hypothetical protein
MIPSKDSDGIRWDFECEKRLTALFLGIWLVEKEE